MTRVLWMSLMLVCAAPAYLYAQQVEVGTVRSKSLGEDNATLEYLAGASIVATGKLGSPQILPEGQYRVRLKQDNRVVGVSGFFDVESNKTTDLKPFYSAIRFFAKNAQGDALRQPVRLYAKGNTRPTIDTKTLLFKQKSKPYLIQAGAYRLEVGAKKYGQRFDLWFPAHQTIDHILIMNRGRLVRLVRQAPDSILKKPLDVFQVQWKIAGDVAFARARYGLGMFNGDVLRLGGVSNLRFNWQWPAHQFGVGASFEQSWLSAEHILGDVLEFEKLVDELKLFGDYQWRLFPWMSLYSNLWVKAPAFGTYYTSSSPRSIELTDERGRTGIIPVDQGQRLRMWRPFTPLFAQQEAGVKFPVWRNAYGFFEPSMGVALRQSVYRGGFYVINSTGTTFTAFRPYDTQHWGGTVGFDLGFYVTERLHVMSSVHSFWSYSPMVEQQSPVPVLAATLSATLDLSDFASLEYKYVLNKEDFQLPRAQQRHLFGLRFFYDIL